MNGKIQISVRALVVGGLCALILALAVWQYLTLKRDVRAGFEAFNTYIGACQETGVLPTPEALKERLDALDKAQKAAEAEKK